MEDLAGLQGVQAGDDHSLVDKDNPSIRNLDNDVLFLDREGLRLVLSLA
jgi:hypothetical protein